MTLLGCGTRLLFTHSTRRRLYAAVRSTVPRYAFSNHAEGGGDQARIQRTSPTPGVLNTLSGCIDSLPEPSAGTLKWYSCGPTVYDSAHLGHGRTYVSLDIIRRILVDYFHFDVIYALGITDVDDKIINRARERGLKHWHEIDTMAKKIENEFLKDMDDLGVRRPDAVTRVTEHLPEIIAYIDGIMKNGMAYEAESGVYFDVEGMGSGYGKLGVGASDSTTPAEELEASESDLRGKRSHRDFALWKKAKPGEPWWESPFGRGRPGWHIECSAMTHSLFGEHLDIHSGGIDLKFPHHTNEIAQCEAYSCRVCPGTEQDDGRGMSGEPESKPWVKHWIHTGHLHIEGRKMSKSLKNFITVREYLDAHRGGPEEAAEDFRMFCLMHKYSASVTFSEDRMEEARVIRGRIERFLSLADTTLREAANNPSGTPSRWGDKDRWLVGELAACRREVNLALSDDFDTPRAIRHLAALCSVTSMHINSEGAKDLGPVRAAAQFAASTLGMLGLGSSRSRAEAGQGGAEEEGTGLLPPAREAIAAMVELRRAMRQIVLSHNLSNPKSIPNAKMMKRELLQLADRTRDETLRDLGVQVDDGPRNTCAWMLIPSSPRRAPSHQEGEMRQQPPSSRRPSDSGGNAADRDGKEQAPPWVVGTGLQAEGDRQ